MIRGRSSRSGTSTTTRPPSRCGRSSVSINTLCVSKRSVEMSTDGHVVQCPGCRRWTMPTRWPSRQKGRVHTVVSRSSTAIGWSTTTSSPTTPHGDVAHVYGDSYDERDDPLERFRLQHRDDRIRYRDRTLYEGDNCSSDRLASRSPPSTRTAPSTARSQCTCPGSVATTRGQSGVTTATTGGRPSSRFLTTSMTGYSTGFSTGHELSAVRLLTVQAVRRT